MIRKNAIHSNVHSTSGEYETMNGVKWLKDCEICNTGLCKQMAEHKEVGKTEREAARMMEEECDGLWSAKNIRDRYRYYTKVRGGGISATRAISTDTEPGKEQNSNTVKEVILGGRVIIATEIPQQKTYWKTIEQRLASLVEYSKKNSPCNEKKITEDLAIKIKTHIEVLKTNYWLNKAEND